MPIAAIAAVIGTVLAVDGYIKGEEARKEASEAQGRQRQAQEKMQSEQKAQNAQQAQSERIKQRRELIRRQAVLRQSAYNTGTTGASGEFGALSGLETGLSTAIGENVGAQQSANTISSLAQDNANAGFDFATAGQNMQGAQSQMSLGMNLFDRGASAGGVDQVKSLFASSSPAPTTKQVIHSNYNG